MGRYCDPDELLTEVMLALLRVLPRYDPALGSMDAYVLSRARWWAMKLCQRLTRPMGVRTASRREFRVTEITCDIAAEPVDLDTCDEVSILLEAVSDDDRELLRMRWSLGLTVQEVADLKGYSKATAVRRCNRALRNVRAEAGLRRSEKVPGEPLEEEAT